MDRAIPSAFAGNAGEFFVLAELTRRGWTAALAARNNRAYDILAKRDDEFAAIRVKTKTSAFTLFQWNAEPSGEIFLEMTQEGDFCVLVDIPEDTNHGPAYYIVPTPVIDKWLKDDSKRWSRLPASEAKREMRPTSADCFTLTTTQPNWDTATNISWLRTKGRGSRWQRSSTPLTNLRYLPNRVG